MNDDSKKAIVGAIAFAFLGIILMIYGLIGFFTPNPHDVHGPFQATAQPGIANSQCMIEVVMGILAIGLGAYLAYWNFSE